MKLLILCHANVCRSPLARSVLQFHLRSANDVYVSSAGLSATPLLEICEVARQLTTNYLPTYEHTPLQVNTEMLKESDLVLTMSKAQSKRALEHFPDARRRIFTLVEAAAMSNLARQKFGFTKNDWAADLPEVLNELRGLATIPALSDPRGWFHSRLEPGRIMDAHELRFSAHKKTLDQVIFHSAVLAGVEIVPLL